MHAIRISIAASSALLLSGCYLFHELERAPGLAMLDGGARDASAIPARDAAPSRVPDASGPPLPAEPDPDLGPDARPSDYPDADDWEEPPPPGETDPCCTMDEPIQITSRDEGMAFTHDAPVIAWGPGRWGLLATRYTVAPDFEHDPRGVVFELAPDGRSLGPPRVLDRTTNDRGVLRWAEGRWAVAMTTMAVMSDVREWVVRLNDRDFRAASEWHDVGRATHRQMDLARLTSGDSWLAIGDHREGVAASSFTETSVEASRELAVEPGSTLDAVGMRSRAAVLIGRHDRSGTSSELVVIGPRPTHDLLGRVPLATSAVERAALAAVRDLVIAVVIDDGDVRATAIDPFVLSAVAPGRTVTSVSPDVEVASRTALDAAGSSKFGVAGVCYGEGGSTRREAWIDFRLVGADGAPRGRAVRVVDDPFRGGMVNCSVGSDENGFLVAWWDGSALWVRRIHVARRE